MSDLKLICKEIVLLYFLLPQAMGDMKKSSASPVEVKSLDKVHVLETGMGVSHSLFLARNETEADKKAIESYAILDQSDLD